MRFYSSDAHGQCLATRCFESGDAALRDVARGNYEAWRLARHDATGLYLDGINLVDPAWVETRAATGVTGLGLMMEADLDTADHASHWVLQGVALVLNIDS